MRLIGVVIFMIGVFALTCKGDEIPRKEFSLGTNVAISDMVDTGQLSQAQGEELLPVLLSIYEQCPSLDCKYWRPALAFFAGHYGGKIFDEAVDYSIIKIKKNWQENKRKREAQIRRSEEDQRERSSRISFERNAREAREAEDRRNRCRGRGWNK